MFFSYIKSLYSQKIIYLVTVFEICLSESLECGEPLEFVFFQFVVYLYPNDFNAVSLQFAYFVPEIPKFGEPISNVTVPVGREAVLTCAVENLSTYKVSD